MSDTVVPMRLTANDRCDSCGAQAYVRVTLPHGGLLLFCAHDARKHTPKLKEKGYVIVDETAALLTAR
jgi:hypothetical protein